MIAHIVRASIFALLFPVAAQATVFEMKIFGDSLSDTGNLFALSGGQIPPIGLYDNGRFSNGPNWVDQVAATLGAGPVNNVFQTGTLSAGIDNFAVGGAYTGSFTTPIVSANSNDLRLAPPAPVFPGLQQQVGAYSVLSGGGALVNPEALHVIWAGANDLLFTPVLVDTAPATILDAATTAVDNIGTAIGNLYGLGAREFMLFNMPNIGATPFGDLSGLGPLLSLGSAQFNAELTTLVASLPGVFPGIDVTTFDVNTQFADVLAGVVSDPALMALFAEASDMAFVADGLSFCIDQDGITIPLGVGGPVFCPPGEGDERVFHDLVHPSTTTHGIIAAGVIESTVPEPGTLSLALVSLLPLGWIARRRKSGSEVRFSNRLCGFHWEGVSRTPSVTRPKSR